MSRSPHLPSRLRRPPASLLCSYKYADRQRETDRRLAGTRSALGSERWPRASLNTTIVIIYASPRRTDEEDEEEAKDAISYLLRLGMSVIAVCAPVDPSLSVPVVEVPSS